MRYKGVDLLGLVECAETHQRWSGNPDVYEAFGTDLMDHVYLAPIKFDEGSTRAYGLAYHVDHPTNVFSYVMVNWSQEDWTQAKSLIEKTQVKALKEQRLSSLIDSGVVQKEESVRSMQRRYLDALILYKGSTKKASKDTGIHVGQHLVWKQNSAEYQRELSVVEETKLDMVESNLMDLIEEGDRTSTMFYLKEQGASRGYGKKEDSDKAQLSGSDSLPLEALTTEEQRQLSFLMDKMENFDKNRIGKQ